MLLASVNITKSGKDEEVLDANTKLGPTNNFLHSLFSGLKVFFNNQELINVSNYALYAYLSLKLCSTMDDVNTFLKTSIYEPDIANHFEGFDKDNTGKYFNY